MIMTCWNKSYSHKIGTERPENAVIRGVYTGSDPKLQDKTAYIARCEGGWVVQVDDRASDFAYGWWKFPYEDWTEQ